MAMPDRIWAGSVLIDGGFIDGKVALPVWDTDKSGRPWEPTEFIRADLVDELVKALEGARDYLTALEGNLIANDADMMLDACDPPSAVADRIDAALLRAKGGDSPHSDDLAVDRFAAAMKTKLAQKRAEGRGGWDDKDACSGEWLSRLLRGHVEKGDPVDVANFAMMLHQRGERIAP